MANFIALIDADAERRARFLERVTPLLPPVADLVSGSCSAGPFAIVWAAGPHAPISVDAGADAAIVFGLALRAEPGAPVTARELREAWPGDRTPEAFDGYHAAITYRRAGGLLAGADILGCFPVYYWSSATVLLVGSSPELFHHHESFRGAFDPAGLAGILLMNGLVDGRTLFQGVRRLGPGCVLAARPGEPPCELRQYEIPVSDRFFDVPLERQVEALDEVLDHSMRRHAPASPRPVMLLSGGLDSRLLAGYLDRHGVSPVALTHGAPRDLEMRCAVRVARRLGFEHHGSEGDPARFLADASARVHWEQCANGFSGAGGWGSHRELRSLGTRVIGGHGLDWVIGAYGPPDQGGWFEAYFERHNRWGLSPARLGRLLRPEVFEDSVAEVVAALRRSFAACSGVEFQRAWGHALHHRQRFHIAGHHWPASFGAWPVVPALDRELIAFAGGLPSAALEGRALETELACRRFPKLARLPLDRNSYNTDPLLPSFAHKVRRYFRRRARRVLQRLAPSGGRPAEERRQYYRQYDINSARWRSVRAAAEPFRKLGYEYFERAALDDLLPPPQAEIRLADSIIDSAGIKSVLGFLLWRGHAES